ncbi:MAG TPA: carboxypeptidase regulatory-like domain-containing protein [Pyrinomonadaceae bacterium]|jgi:hypothetical protein
MKIFKPAAALAFLFVLLSIPAFAQVKETGGVKGKVRNAKGNAVSGATITARREGTDVKTVQSDAKGNFELTGLEPGVYNFVFEKAGYGAGVKYNVEVKKKSVISLGDNLALTQDPGTLILINGSVYNQDGRSITGAKIEIERIDSDGSTKKVGSSYSSVSGEFTFRQPEGTAKFRVTATMKGVSGAKEIAVDSAGIYRLAITLNIPKEKQ